MLIQPTPGFASFDHGNVRLGNLLRVVTGKVFNCLDRIFRHRRERVTHSSEGRVAPSAKQSANKSSLMTVIYNQTASFVVPTYQAFSVLPFDSDVEIFQRNSILGFQDRASYAIRVTGSVFRGIEFVSIFVSWAILVPIRSAFVALASSSISITRGFRKVLDWKLCITSGARLGYHINSLLDGSNIHLVRTAGRVSARSPFAIVGDLAC